MTGQRPSPRGRGDPWRGGRPTSGGGAGQGDGGSTLPGHAAHVGPELEDLPAGEVRRSGARGVGASTALAAIAVVALVATGLGVLGGRAAPSPSGPAGTGAILGSAEAAASGPGAGAASLGPGPTPRVTPAEPCGPTPDRAPDVYLEVNGVSTRGGFPESSVLLPADATTAVWIADAACAVAWHIRLAIGDGILVPVAIQANPSLDPAFAQQNRFELSFGEERDVPGDHRLEAAFDFTGGLGLVASWPVRFPPLDRPAMELHVAETGVAIPTIEGCDVVLTLRNGEQQQPGCDQDLSSEPGPATKLAPGTQVEVSIAGWSLTELSVICGSESDGAFAAAPGPDCIADQGGSTFTAPGAGDWTVAIAACAVGYTQFAANRICGTWYASIDTREAIRNEGS